MPRGVYERRPDRYPRLQPPQPPLAPCAADGCDRLATRKAAGLCEKHFSRMRRTGTLMDPPAPTLRYYTSDGYIRIIDRGHPLAGKLGYLLEHRKVFYDARGPGPFLCHWCDVEVTWRTLHIDHLNDVKDDNRLDNLVASCHICNPMRGFHKSLASNRANGTHYTLNGERLPAGVWAERLGISIVSLKARVRAGWPMERALTEPRGKFGPKGDRR